MTEYSIGDILYFSFNTNHWPGYVVHTAIVVKNTSEIDVDTNEMNNIFHVSFVIKDGDKHTLSVPALLEDVKDKPGFEQITTDCTEQINHMRKRYEKTFADTLKRSSDAARFWMDKQSNNRAEKSVVFKKEIKQGVPDEVTFDRTHDDPSNHVVILEDGTKARLVI